MPQLQSTAKTNCKLTADNLPGMGETLSIVGVGVNRVCKDNMACVVSQPTATAEHGPLASAFRWIFELNILSRT